MTKLDKWLSVLVPSVFTQIIFIVIPKILILLLLAIFKVVDARTFNLIELIGVAPDMLFMIIVSIMIIIQKVREWRYK